MTIRSDWVGRVIDDRFPLLQWLGGSEWGGVFLTEFKGPGSQKAAIKLIPAKRGGEKAYLASWASAGTLSHPNLMRLLYTGRCELDDAPLVYAVTEYADEVLSEVISERALKPDEVREMLVPVLNALFYLHGKGYVHGHLKPSNIMAVDNQLKLSVDSLEVAGEPGTHFRALSVYDAPEIGDGVISPAADVWSLGATLVEVLTQHAPVWDSESRKQPIVSESMPEPFARIARECLHENPAQRCTLADVNKARLGQFRRAASFSEPARAVKPKLVRPGRIAGVTAAIVLAVIVGAMYLGLHHASAPGVAKPQAANAAGTAAQQASSSLPGKPAREIPRPQAGISEAGAKQQGPPAIEGNESGAVAERVVPDVPQKSLNTIHGTVRVRIRVAVDASGNVTDAKFESAGPSRYFANLAMEAAQKWRFQPGNAGVQRIEFDFRRTGVEAAMEREH